MKISRYSFCPSGGETKVAPVGLCPTDLYYCSRKEPNAKEIAPDLNECICPILHALEHFLVLEVKKNGVLLEEAPFANQRNNPMRV